MGYAIPPDGTIDTQSGSLSNGSLYKSNASSQFFTRALPSLLNWTYSGSPNAQIMDASDGTSHPADELIGYSNKVEIMPSSKFHRPRRATQLASLLLIALIPAFGIFKIDLAAASFQILGLQIWWLNFAFMFGLAIVVVTVPIISYMTIGTIWCGWACPQNLLSEFANNLTYKFLGKRADVRVDGKGIIVAAAKNKAINWLVLGIIFLGIALVLAFIPLLFFYEPGEMFALVPFVSGHKASSFLKMLYFFTVFLIFVDIAVVRYFFCDYACLYRLAQRIFKTQDALHIAYDASRSADCSKCNYCATSCITAIQPTNIKIYDPCTGCGECVDACDHLHEGSGKSGLLFFEIGKKGANTTWRQKLGEMSTRFNWMIGAFFMLGCALMVWGIAMQEPIQSQASRDTQLKNQQIARVCNSQCATLQSSCNVNHMEGCYRGAACKCQCSLQQDPTNDFSGAWRQCVQVNTAHAEALGSRKIVNPAAKP